MKLDFKYLLQDLVRTIVALLGTSLSYIIDTNIFVIAIFVSFFSIIWTIINLFNLINYETNNYFSNIPAINDCFGLALFTYLTGNINSIFPIFFIVILVVSLLGAGTKITYVLQKIYLRSGKT